MISPPPSELSSAIIQHSFGRLQAQEGERTARQGQVQLERLSHLNETDLEISAQVWDRKVNPYQTQLYYQPTDDWILSGDCTCPSGSDCRHCAAVAYAWLEQKPDPVASEAELRQWLDALQGAQEAEERPPTEPTEAESEICYLLQPSDWDPDFLQVQVLCRSRTGKRWRKPTPLSPAELTRHPAAQDSDRELVTLLRSQSPVLHSKASAATLLLSGRSGQLLLEQLLATGRAHAVPTAQSRQSLGPLLQSGAARRVALDWQSVPGGQKLSPQVQPPASHCFRLHRQSYYLDPERGEIGPVELSPQKLALLQAAPVVPPAAMETVSRALLRILPAPPLPKDSSLQEEVLSGLTPVPVLTLQGTDIAEGTEGSETQHLAWLHFDYAGQRLPAQNPATPFQPETSHLQGEHVYRIQRHREAEQQALKQLLKTGLLPLQDQPGRYGFAGDRHKAQSPVLATAYLRNWHHWLHDSLSHLRALGWQIEMEPSFRLAFLTSPSWQAELSAHHQQEGCFALALGLELNGERVDLLPLLLRLLKTVPEIAELRQKLASHETWLLPLDPPPLESWAARSQHQQLPQRWLEVPTRRLIRILDLLVELYEPLKSDGNADPHDLLLSSFQALQLKTRQRLNPDDYGVHWQAPAGLEAAASRLAGLQGEADGLAEIPPPAGLQAQLRPYQQRGLNWLQTLRELGLNGILADDMGLGKTLQTLAHLQVEKAAGRLSAPALVVAPTSVLENWQREAARFTPELRCLLLQGPERPKEPEALKQADLLLTSYTLMRQDQQLHLKMHYSWLILDEAQQIKNPRARTARLLCAQPAQHRLCLSGTPLENNLEELWSLFHFLMPGFLGTLERFNSRYRHPIERQGDHHQQEMLRERVRPLMLRRRKVEVERDLPPKIEILRTVRFDNAQRDLYETLRLAVDHQVSAEIEAKGFKRSRLVILDALLKLRQVCCHPQLLKLPAAQKVRRSAKLELLLELLPELLAEGRRILIFSQFVSMLELIEVGLQKLDLDYLKLTGRSRQRQRLIDRFQNGEVPLFLISLKAGGLGLNLTAADTVIHYDPWWNPASEAQATDRAWRIGQVQPVFVYKLIAAGTVEERILALQAAKDHLREGLFDENGTGNLAPETLLSLLQT